MPTPVIRLKVDLEGRLVLPGDLREEYGIKKGDYVSVRLESNVMMIWGNSSIGELMDWIRKYRRRMREKGLHLREIRLKDLVEVDLEDVSGRGVVNYRMSDPWE